MLRLPRWTPTAWLALLLGCSASPADGPAVPLIPSSEPSPAAGAPSAVPPESLQPASPRDVADFLAKPQARDLCAEAEQEPAPAPSSSAAVEPPPVFVGHIPRAPVTHPPVSFGTLPPEVLARIQRLRRRHLANVRACCAVKRDQASVEACLREKEPPDDSGVPRIVYPFIVDPPP
jgi:hypothetical protein